MRQFLDFDAAANAALLVNNFDWIEPLQLPRFPPRRRQALSVNVMLAKDSVKGRLETRRRGISYTEFSYMLLQAYDFVYLQRQHGCELQIGGSDQWGNITAGIDLARRMRGAQLYGITCPLLLKSDGTKMGKTETGAVWLVAERTSPYAVLPILDQRRRRRRRQVLRFLTSCRTKKSKRSTPPALPTPHKRESQRRLAEELTRWSMATQAWPPRSGRPRFSSAPRSPT